jgi:outer membrane protein TolC
MRKFAHLVVGFVGAFASNAFAASIADVYQAAVENDPVLGAALQEYTARSELVPQSRSALLPNVSLNGSTSYNKLEYPKGAFVDTDPTSPSFGQLRGIEADDFNRHTWQAQLVQPLIDVAAFYNYRGA